MTAATNVITVGRQLESLFNDGVYGGDGDGVSTELDGSTLFLTLEN